jgi:hypothetical protein
VDDGACDHLVGLSMPDVRLPSTSGEFLGLREVTRGSVLIYVYPRTAFGDGHQAGLPESNEQLAHARNVRSQSGAPP